MDINLIAPLALYTFVCTATPGPNNIMLASSGLAFGIRRTVPHMLGISFGIAAMLILCGLGLGAVFEQWPALRWLLRIAGALYLLWLAWKLWNLTEVSPGQGAHPLRFWQATIFQFINPKAWAMTVTAIASFSTAGRPLSLQLALITGVFVLVALPSNAAWTALGAGARELLDSREALTIFVRFMAVLTALTALIFLI